MENGITALTCSSENDKYEKCVVIEDDNNKIIDIVEKYSYSECIKDKSFGFLDNYIWVKSSCKATFAVKLENIAKDSDHHAESPSINPVSIFQEGTQKISKSYISDQPTELILHKTFSGRGKLFVITLSAGNLHTKNDSSLLTWNVMCGSKVEPLNWTMEYIPYKR